MAQQRRRVAIRKQATKGAVHAVPCPYCGHKNDFRKFVGTSEDWGTFGLEPGSTFSCDKCKRISIVKKVAKVMVITLEQHNR
jgi:hypothetical protein